LEFRREHLEIEVAIEDGVVDGRVLLRQVELEEVAADDPAADEPAAARDQKPAAGHLGAGGKRSGGF